MSQAASSSPLAGLVVIDASQVISGPLAAMILGDYGARVIKVEHPVKGDDGRRLGTPGSGQWWAYLSRNKECVTCDLAHPEGKALFKRLTAKADVVIENFRPGTFERWGLGYSELSKDNPSLVMLRISGFGQDGPYSGRPGYGGLAEAMGGLAYLTGEPDGPPTLPGAPVADPMTGAMGALAVMMTLWARDRGEFKGKGAEIDLSLYGPMLYLLGTYITDTARLGENPKRGGQLGHTVPKGLAVCRDGTWFAYSIIAPYLIDRALELMRNRGCLEPGAERLPNGERNVTGLKEALRLFARERDRSAVLEELSTAGLPAAPVNSVSDILADPMFLVRDEFVHLTDAAGKEVVMPRPPFRLGSKAADIRPLANELGQHNRAVYGDWLGLPKEEIDRLASLHVI